MPFCENCGKRFDDTQKFCPYCGEKNSLIEEERIETQQTQVSQAGDYDHQGDLETVNDFSQLINPKDIALEMVIKGRYKIEEKLFEKDIYTIYKAWDIDAECYKALKFINSEYYNNIDVLSMIKTEALLLMKVVSDNVVRVWDIHFDENLKYIDMEYVEGESLYEILKSQPQKQLSESRVLKIIYQIVNGISHIESKRLSFLGLNLKQIMLNKADKVKITGIGLEADLLNVNSHKTCVNEFPYLAPEQIETGRSNIKSAIWSLGMLAWELLTGEFYYNQPVNFGSGSKPIIQTITIKGQFSKITNQFLGHCLSINPERRFSSFRQIKKILSEGIDPGSEQFSQIDESDHIKIEEKKETDRISTIGEKIKDQDLQIIENIDAELTQPYDTGISALKRSSRRATNIVLIAIVLMSIIGLTIYYNGASLNRKRVKSELQEYGDKLFLITIDSARNKKINRTLEPGDEEFVSGLMYGWTGASKKTRNGIYTFKILKPEVVRMVGIGKKKGIDKKNRLKMVFMIYKKNRCWYKKLIVEN